MRGSGAYSEPNQKAWPQTLFIVEAIWVQDSFDKLLNYEVSHVLVSLPCYWLPDTRFCHETYQEEYSFHEESQCYKVCEFTRF